MPSSSADPGFTLKPRSNPAIDLSRPAGFAIKLVYTLALLATCVASAAGSGGWVGLALGSMPLGGMFLVIVAVALARIVQVWRDPAALATPRLGAAMALLRAFGIVQMLVGSAAALALVAMKPLVQFLFGGVHSDDGIEYFIIGLFGTVLALQALVGVLHFEGVRLVALQRAVRARNDGLGEREGPVLVWTTVVAWGLVTLGGLLLFAGILYRGKDVGQAALQVAFALPSLIVIALRVRSLAATPRSIPLATPGGVPGALRKAAIVLLLVSVAAWSVVLGFGALGRTPGGGVLLVATLASPWSGVIVLEFSRLLGFEQAQRKFLEDARMGESTRGPLRPAVPILLLGVALLAVTVVVIRGRSSAKEHLSDSSSSTHALSQPAGRPRQPIESLPAPQAVAPSPEDDELDATADSTEGPDEVEVVPLEPPPRSDAAAPSDRRAPAWQPDPTVDANGVRTYNDYNYPQARGAHPEAPRQDGVASRATPGDAGLEQLVREGRLRRATRADLVAWMRATSGDEEGDSPPRHARPGDRQYVPRHYVVLREISLPPGLSSSVTLIVPRNVPPPRGDPGECRILKMP